MENEGFGILAVLTDVTNTPKLPANIEEGVREDGTVDDTVVETHYCEIDNLTEADGYLRVTGDNGFTDVEIRIPFDRLNALGWQKVGA